MKKVLLSVLAVFMVFCNAQIVKGEGMIEEGKIIKMDYTLTVEGEVVDSSEGKEPLEYTQGQGMIIPGLEKELVGLKAGDKKQVTVAAAEAYGEVNPELLIEIPKDRLQGDIDPQAGMVLQMTASNGQPVAGVVKEVKEAVLLMDFNHPLAGQELNFDVTIVDVN